MKILITGSTGLLGQALCRHLGPSCEVTGLSRSAAPAAGERRHLACDVLDAERIGQAIRAARADIVIHAQAMSDVDRCEQEPDAAWAQNARAVTHVARALQGTDTLLMHISTDYVFDGAKGAPYDEADRPNPISVYGRSKLEGERAALQHPRAVVVRTSTLFGPGRMNFCDHIVSRVQQRQPVQAFVDQVTSPTYTEDLADGIAAVGEALWRASDTDRPRICHIVNAGACSRLAFAQRVVSLLGGSADLIQAMPMASQRRPAARPAYSALTTTQLPRMIGRILRPWDDALQAYLRHRHWLN